MDLIKQIYKKGLLILLPLAFLSAFMEWKKLPAGILAGGALGLANLKGLAWGVRGLFGTGRAGGVMVFFSIFRLMMLFAILALLVYLRLVNVFGVLIGFTVIFLLVMIEGLRYAKHADRDAS
ncbi:MAG: hypothetical protein M0Z60_00385 [Nitrospiraceae bacterium]|nr:hypothetical protein [Nitrospiraceae bacterium]